MYDHIWRYPTQRMEGSPYANLLGQKAPGLLQTTSQHLMKTQFNALMEQFTARQAIIANDAHSTVARLLTFALAPLKFYPK